MQGMNFLNKKYVSSHQQSLSQSRSSKTFLPSHQYSQHHNSSHQAFVPQPPHSPSTINNSHSSATLISNHCQIHPQQLIRHICVDCIELLCAQCIGEHLSAHRQSNTFPTMQTLKQVKSDMNVKLQQVMQYMFKQQNHPKYITSTIQNIRKQSADKIQNLRKDIIEYTDEWIGRLKGSVLNNVGYEQVKVIKDEMYGLQEQINSLNNCLSQNSVSAQAIKKAYQIDAERLQNSYKEMLQKYRNLSQTMKVDIQIDYNQFLRGLQKSIQIKIGGNSSHGDSRMGIIRVDEQNQQKQQNPNKYSHHHDLPLQQQQHPNKPKNNKVAADQQQDNDEGAVGEDIPYLFNLPSGSTIFSYFEPKGAFGNQILQYGLNGVSSYALNSVALLPDSMVVVSGGMISQSKKSPLVQIFDYTDGALITQSKLKKGRSSHQTIPYGDRIFFIGGFTSEDGQCQDVQILSGQGMNTCQYQCKWGGPNLSLIFNGKIFKVTVSGVQYMDLDTLQWHQINTDVPFALSKGMQIENLNGSLYIFGEDYIYYRWDEQKSKFITMESSIKLGNISCVTVNNGKIYGWMDNQKSLAMFDGDKWTIFDNFAH